MATDCGGHWVEQPEHADPRPSDEDNDRMGGMVGMMMRSNNHATSDTRIRDKLLSMLLSERAQNLSNGPQQMTIRIKLNSVKPTIWRRFRVSRTLSLHDLHQKVIAPSLGWATQYHGCFFKIKSPLRIERTGANWV
jgi:hypothetical protein